MTTPTKDPESEAFLDILSDEERVRAHRIPGVRTVLVVLSSRGMVLDRDALRQKILFTYPDSAVFYMTPLGQAVGTAAPRKVDLLVDLTGPGERQAGLCFPRKLRGRARVAVGRNAGLFRKRVYDRVYNDQTKSAELPQDVLERERVVQREVLALGGIAVAQRGEALRDQSHTIALGLPPISRL